MQAEEIIIDSYDDASTGKLADTHYVDRVKINEGLSGIEPRASRFPNH